MKYLVPLLIVGLVSGCATPAPQPITATAIAAATKVTRDPYAGATFIHGPDEPLPAPSQDDWHMGDWALLAASNQPNIQLYVHYWRSDWAFLDTAHDSEGNPLVVQSLDRNVDGAAMVHEYVGIPLTRTYLDSHRATGLNLRIDGQRGSAVVIVPPAYLDGFLSVVAQQLPNG